MSEEPNNSQDVITFRWTPTAVVVTFKEKRIYDVRTVEAVEDQIRSILAKDPANMVVNFSNVDFMVTRVINILLVALKWVRARGGEVYLSGMNPNIRRVFKLMRLTEVFRIFQTEEQALADLENQEK
ncbi:MAG: STAS domain-containing protein [Actinobacteria bacterium]|nr:STAS domain-containing protein [Actinomycetota bacterium]